MRSSLDTLASALCYAMGIAPPEKANTAEPRLTEYADAVLKGEKSDRIFLYNPDAIGQWVYEKYGEILKKG